MTVTPWQCIMVALAGWMNRILREKLGHKRLIPDDNQNCRLAIAGTRASLARSPDNRYLVRDLLAAWQGAWMKALADRRCWPDSQRARVIRPNHSETCRGPPLIIRRTTTL